MIENECQYWNERFNDEQRLRDINQSLNNIHFEQCRPSTIYKPRLYWDGKKWCALYGDDRQSGVTGFGKSPCEAFLDFDNNWKKKID